jgi:hypothetical protein
VRLVAFALAIEQQPQFLAIQPVLRDMLARKSGRAEIGGNGLVRDLQLSLEAEERSAHAPRGAASDLEGHPLGVGRAMNTARGESRLTGQHDKQRSELSAHRSPRFLHFRPAIAWRKPPEIAAPSANGYEG